MTGSSGHLGYQVQVTSGGGGVNPVANAQSVSLRENTTASITVTGSDPNYLPAPARPAQPAAVKALAPVKILHVGPIERSATER
ncbi:hypothetical protein SBV1_2390010 [Verrucomicrobia bacterium]|nr:hypothetical protein SBV1_2390010 [Verrucomicrobiota bacterium]